ncbi:MAG TPA: response regulator transcription factor [Luteimonas sp.]|nr:response regulator transcription factor [Luteimonas sp.]
MQRVLVVEDDEELRERILLPGLRDAGFEVRGANSALAMYRELLSHDADVVVLDVGLPDEDGFQAAAHLRGKTRAGIVMLTGRQSNRDRVRGLDQGADAYLVKPVDMPVLVATVRSVLRRTPAAAAGFPAAHAPTPALAPRDGVPGRWSLTADGWHLVAPDGTRLLLGAGERVLLERLARQRGEVVARDVLAPDLVAALDDFDPHRIEMLVHRLRRKVLAGTGLRLPLETVRGAGYVFVDA